MKNEEEKKFEKMFGMSRNDMGEVLLISPFFHTKLVTPELSEQKFFKGMIFHGLNGIYKSSKMTFINTGMGQNLVVDCILAQDPNKIKAVIFLGALGAVKDLEIADSVVITEAIFDTQYHKKFGINFNGNDQKTFYPDAQLLENSLDKALALGFDLKQANVISIHTFWDQTKQRVQELTEMGAQSVDLECALFYAASHVKKIKSIAVCFVSDNIASRPFWGKFSAAERVAMKNKASQLVRLGLELGLEQKKF
ncbi:MAG: hypothetical protein KAS13_08790 [Candidatus Omnitrophica bacterium]|nr:hypothetical protein [Candidatus Omnitrophota bacterium]